MKKRLLISSIIGITLLQGCSTFQKHDDVNWGEGTCPAPTADQLGKGGALVMQDGVTPKCQIRPYVSNMACKGITDETHADGVICQNAQGKSAVFIFDEKGILKIHKFY